MISNKDLRVEGSNLIINGEKHPLDPAVNALTKRANIVQGKFSALDTKLDAIEALEKNASGNPISLTGVAAAYAMSNIMTIEPIQSGSGDPSPTNVRPISGLTEGKVVACGKNLIDISKYAISPLTLEDGILTGTGNQFNSKLSLNSVENPAFIVPLSEAYTISVAAYTDGNITTEGSGIWVQVLYEDGTYSSVLRFPNNTTTRTAYTATFNKKPVKIGFIYAEQGANIWHIDSIQLEVGSTPTPYEPYTAANATITLGQTVYGGSVNFKTGEVTVTHGNIASYNGETINEPWISSMDKYESGATPTTGAQVVYPLTTPTTLTLTPAELELLKGNNTVSGNGANINISYIGR